MSRPSRGLQTEGRRPSLGSVPTQPLLGSLPVAPWAIPAPQACGHGPTLALSPPTGGGGAEKGVGFSHPPQPPPGSPLLQTRGLPTPPGCPSPDSTLSSPCSSCPVPASSDPRWPGRHKGCRDWALGHPLRAGARAWGMHSSSATACRTWGVGQPSAPVGWSVLRRRPQAWPPPPSSP